MSQARQQSQDKRFGAEKDKPRLIRARILSFLTIVLGICYLLWLFFYLNPLAPIISYSFFIAETLAFALFLLVTIDVWRVRYKPPYGLPLGAVKNQSVDIFVTIYKEPIQVISTTLHATKNIQWPGEIQHYVLDDGNNPEVKHIANKLNFHYLSRPGQGITPQNAKAGNLNFGLSHSQNPFILVLDADQVPEPNILEVLCSYMKFQDVALVQSRQDFLVPEGDPFLNRDEVFYGMVQSSFDDDNTVISCGSGVVYRRKALESIGGFVEWNIVEDLTTSFELHAHGWKTFYVPYALAIGTAPDTIQRVYRQRSQWALDTMRLFIWGNVLFKRNVVWRVRKNYATIAFSYFNAGLIFPFLFCIPLWCYLTGGFVIASQLFVFGSLRGLYFLSEIISIRYMFLGYRPSRQYQGLAGLFPVYIYGMIAALFYPPSKKPQYKANVTNKVTGKSKTWPKSILLLPQLVLFFGNMIGPYYALITASAPLKYIFVNTLVSGVCLWTLIPLLAASFLPNHYPKGYHPNEFYT